MSKIHNQYQICTIQGHCAYRERLAENVFLTTWGDGTRLVTNYGDAPFDFESAPG